MGNLESFKLKVKLKKARQGKVGLVRISLTVVLQLGVRLYIYTRVKTCEASLTINRSYVPEAFIPTKNG